jgi:serine/threonine protein kinase
MAGLEGTQLGHYYLLRPLGHGGMSEVYLAYDEDVEREIAVKVVTGNRADSVERFQREASAIDKLKHNHILPPFEYGVQESWHYLAMPYIEHGTLRDRLDKGPLTLEEAGEILTQVASALQFAHDNGILHRDIKPSNILLSNDHYAYLADFGLAKELEGGREVTQTGILLGTPEYMAPELADGPATTSCDIYALGVLLYEMITGYVPFTADTPVATYWKHIRDEPLPPSHFNPAVPPAIDQVILCALQKDPLYRFQTPREMCEAYKRALQAPTSRYATFEEQPSSRYAAFEEQPYSESDMQRQVQPIFVGMPPTQPKARSRLRHRPRVLTHPWWLTHPKNPAVTPGTVPPIEHYRQHADATLLPPSAEDIVTDELQEPVVVHPRPRSQPVRRPKSNRMFISIVAIGVLLFIGLPISGVCYLYISMHTHNQPTGSSAAIGQTIIIPRQPQTNAISGTPLLSDHLDSNTSGRWTEDPTHCFFTGGTYHVAVTQANFLQPCALLTLSLDNVAIQVDVSLLSGHDAGLLLRADGERFYNFEINDQGQFFFRRHDRDGNASYYNLIVGTANKVIAPIGQKNTLLVLASGDDFKLYINGTFVSETHDSTYTSGHIALVTGTQAPQTIGEGSFANFKVFKIK